MPTQEEIYTAIRNADKAGDSESVRKLGAYLQTMNTPPPPPVAPAAPPKMFDDSSTAGKIMNQGVGNDEAALSLGSSAIATPIAGLAGMAQGVKNWVSPGMSAAERVAQVQNAMTYQPRTQEGKDALETVSKPAQWLGEGADKAGQVASDVTGSPAVGAAVNTGIQALPAIVMKRALGTAKIAPGANAAATAAAKNYATHVAGLDWNSLSDAIKTKLTTVAQDAKNLDNLDPAALQREAKLQSLPVPVPATRGQITRDPVALRNEGNVSATNAGAPIRDIHLDQNKALLDNLDVLKNKVTGTGTSAAQATTPQAAGESIQGAARAKLAFQQAKVKSLYQAAQDSGETAAKVDVTPIQDMIQKTPDQSHFGYAKNWINQNTEGAGSGVSINDLEDLRKAAVAKAMNGGEDGYYAGKLISAIDTATDGAGGDLYKAARSARKAQALEFQDQGAVAKLVEDKSRTDRTTALENTVKSIANGSIEDVQNVKRSLLTGGDETTRTAGKTAWRDLRAQVIQDIKDRASNGVAPNERGDPNITPAAMKRAIESYGPAKLDEIFGPGMHRQIADILDATRTVKTLPPGAAVGSSTIANILTFLEKGLKAVPVGGDIVSGAVQKIGELRNLGAAARETKAAMTTPLSDMATKANTQAASAAARAKATRLLPLTVIGTQQNQ